MFHLDTGIHFNKIEFTVRRDKELDRAGVDIIDILHQFDRGSANLLTQFHGQCESRCDLDDLLMAALDGAVTLEQMHHMAVLIAHDLHFHVLRVLDVFFHIDLIAAKSQSRFGLGKIVGIVQVGHAVHHAHPAAAAAVHGLQHDREAHIPGKLLHFRIIHDRAVAAGDILDPGLLGLLAGIDLVAEHDQVLDAGTDEDDPFLFTALGQLRIFGQEPIARMDGIHMVFVSNPDNIVDIQVGIDRFFPFPYQIGLIGTEPMQGQRIFLRINGNRTDPELIAGPENTDGNFAAIGDQNRTNLSHENPSQYDDQEQGKRMQGSLSSKTAPDTQVQCP